MCDGTLHGDDADRLESPVSSPSSVRRHGIHEEEPPQDVFLSDDPALAMVNASMGAWLQAHPCDCHALCECDEGNDD